MGCGHSTRRHPSAVAVEPVGAVTDVRQRGSRSTQRTADGGDDAVQRTEQRTRVPAHASQGSGGDTVPALSSARYAHPLSLSAQPGQAAAASGHRGARTVPSPSSDVVGDPVTAFTHAGRAGEASDASGAIPHRSAPGHATGEGPSPEETNGKQALKMVNKYTMLEVIGKGAYGKVRKCIDESSGQLRAVKILTKSVLKRKRVGKFGTALDNAHKEIAVWKKLDHPNIVRLLDVVDDEAEDKLYMISEYVTGGAVMPDEQSVTPLPPAVAKRMTCQLLDAISYLHFQGVAHRDIKPGNLLVHVEDEAADSTRADSTATSDVLSRAYALPTSDEEEEEAVAAAGNAASATGRFAGIDASRLLLKLTDFGVSQVFEEGNDKSRTTAGTAPFLAPEMLTGGHFSGRAVDMYAMGVTLYVFLYGHPPFMAGSLPALYDLIRTAPIPWPDTTAVGTPISSEALQESRALIERLMDRDPECRMTLAEARAHAYFSTHARLPLPDSAIVVTEQEELEAINRVIKFRALVKAAVVGKKKLAAARLRLSAVMAFERQIDPSLGGSPGKGVISQPAAAPASPPSPLEVTGSDIGSGITSASAEYASAEHVNAVTGLDDEQRGRGDDRAQYTEASIATSASAAEISRPSSTVGGSAYRMQQVSSPGWQHSGGDQMVKTVKPADLKPGQGRYVLTTGVP